METATFVPKLPTKTDRVSKVLLRISRTLLVLAVGVVPLFFLPNIPGLAMFPKVYVTLLLLLLSLVFLSLSILRSGAISLRMSPLILSWWVVVMAGVISAALSPNIMAALFGDALETQTVGFLAFLGLLMSLTLILDTTKKSILWIYGLFTISAYVLSLLFVFRIIFGADFLSLGVLQNLSDNILGSFNDLGIFMGLMVMLTLTAIVQLSLPKKGLVLAGSLLTLALLVLASVNFFYVWLVISLFSLLLLMYSLTKDRFGINSENYIHSDPLSLAGTGMIGLVFLFSVIFLIGGNSLGAYISNHTGVNYIEIRPSVTATFDVMRHVYAENAFTGFGPNRFVEAWSLYKDQSINNTIFWNTPFSAASGYVLTWFITTGLLGALAWLVFMGLYVQTGIKMLIKGQSSDIFWFFTGTISFVSGLFIWLLSFIYVPGPVILIIAAVSTGIMVISSQMLLPQPRKIFNLLASSRTGFVLVAAVMLLIISSIAIGYGSVRQFTAAHTYATASKNVSLADISAYDIISARIINAYNLYPSDTYAREVAKYQLGKANSILTVANPSPDQAQQFNSAVLAAIKSASEASLQKPTDARNWQVLGDIYASVSLVQKEGAIEKAFASYKESEALDPKNPYYVLQKASIKYRSGDMSEAKTLAALALELKPNYTDALFLLSQVAIADGDIENAIAATEAMIAIENNNPGRYYQLGVLYAAIKNTEAAIESFTTAITLNPSYANARYFRAQQYLIAGDINLAISELETVRDLSPDNTSVTDLINKIRSGEVTASTINGTSTITESNQVNVDNQVTTTSEIPESTLLTPVNSGVPQTEQSESFDENTVNPIE